MLRFRSVVAQDDNDDDDDDDDDKQNRDDGTHYHCNSSRVAAIKYCWSRRGR